MEKQSQNNASRRRRGNRSGGGNQQNRQSGGNRNRNRNRSGSGNGNNRNRNRSRRRPAPKPTAWQKFLQTISFGKLGQPKRKPRKQQPKKKTAAAPKADTPRKEAPKRRRNRTEVTSGRLYVGNLTYATTEEELEELFRGFGTVLSAEVVTNSRTQQSKGFAFVEMASIDQAKRAVELLDDEDFMGRKLTVSGARSEGPKDSDGQQNDQPQAEKDEKPEEVAESEADQTDQEEKSTSDPVAEEPADAPEEEPKQDTAEATA